MRLPPTTTEGVSKLRRNQSGRSDWKIDQGAVHACSDNIVKLQYVVSATEEISRVCCEALCSLESLQTSTKTSDRFTAQSNGINLIQ